MEQHKEQAHEYVASTFETVRYSDSMVNKIDSMWATVDAESRSLGGRFPTAIRDPNNFPDLASIPTSVTKSRNAGSTTIYLVEATLYVVGGVPTVSGVVHHFEQKDCRQVLLIPQPTSRQV